MNYKDYYNSLNETYIKINHTEGSLVKKLTKNGESIPNEVLNL